MLLLGVALCGVTAVVLTLFVKSTTAENIVLGTLLIILILIGTLFLDVFFPAADRQGISMAQDAEHRLKAIEAEQLERRLRITAHAHRDETAPSHKWRL